MQSPVVVIPDDEDRGTMQSPVVVIPDDDRDKSRSEPNQVSLLLFK